MRETWGRPSAKGIRNTCESGRRPTGAGRDHCPDDHCSSPRRRPLHARKGAWCAPAPNALRTTGASATRYNHPRHLASNASSRSAPGTPQAGSPMSAQQLLEAPTPHTPTPTALHPAVKDRQCFPKIIAAQERRPERERDVVLSPGRPGQGWGALRDPRFLGVQSLGEKLKYTSGLFPPRPVSVHSSVDWSEATNPSTTTHPLLGEPTREETLCFPVSCTHWRHRRSLYTRTATQFLSFLFA